MYEKWQGQTDRQTQSIADKKTFPQRIKVTSTWTDNHKVLPGVVVQAFNPSTQEAEAGRSVSIRLALDTEQIPGQPELHKEILY